MTATIVIFAGLSTLSSLTLAGTAEAGIYCIILSDAMGYFSHTGWFNVSHLLLSSNANDKFTPERDFFRIRFIRLLASA
jgi:hypothetical protein